MTRPYDPDRHCGAHPDAENGPCRLPKGWGTGHAGTGRCRLHGGAAPQVEAAAARRAQEERALAAARAYGVPRHVDPAEGLLERIAATAGAVDWLRERVEEVAATRVENLIMGTRLVKRAVGPLGETTTSEVAPAVHLWLELYQRESRFLAELCKVALAAGVEERRIRLAERQGDLLVSVIDAILADLRLTAEQQARVPEIVPRHLRAVSG